ncbi:sialic acid-binding Ig-like lectin 14 [Eucyclogobius newberryi]|uniref:sialic acid-binding Ig-like lectin 14 n=1 Tax=Eucyclogobius newberryi TaxID=166745 RepID=UPI003B5BDF7A
MTGNVLGDVKRKNCTTVFGNFTEEQNGVYFFRLDCPKSLLKYTFTQGVHITVKQGVAPPSLTSVTSLSHVTEGGQVRLQCSVMVPCPSLPPSVTWTAPESKRHERVQILQTSDGQMMLRSTLTFTAAARHHNRTVACSVSHPLPAGGSTESFISSHTLSVLYGPSSTAAEVSVSGPVSEGRVVVFSCSSRANPPVSAYAWFSDTNGTMVKVGDGRTLPLQVTQSHSGLYQCQARSERGAQRSEPLVLEVTAQTGPCAGLWLFVVCGALSALYVLTVALFFHKYGR